MPDTIQNAEGESISALYGYLLWLSKFLKHTQNSHLAFAFDESLDTCFRNKIYPDYKSSRGLPDENLAWQLSQCKKLTAALGIATFASKRYEADDLIGSLATQFRNKNRQCVFVTRDKDLGQLLRAGDEIWDFPEGEKLSSRGFLAKMGVKPEQFADFLALTGDKIDDIPGVSGLGPKSAVALLNHFGSLEVLYKEIDKVQYLPIRGARSLQERLIEHKDMALVSQKLANIYCELTLTHSFQELRWSGFTQKRFYAALTRAGIEGRSRKAIENAFA